MGSSIDTTPPAPQPHLTLYGKDYVAKKRATTEAAFSDLKMIQSIARTMTRKPDIPDRKGPVSLNADARKSEIFRIMKENHRLLDRLETLEPIVSTTDLLRTHKDRKRYTINVSHSKRLAGEYDDDVMRIRMEDKLKAEAQNRSLQARMTKAEQNRMQNSMSMPSLTPMAATDPAVLTTAKASPAPKRPAKPVVTKQLGGSGGMVTSSSSSKSAPPPPSEATAAKSVPSRDSKVSFSGGGASQEQSKSEELQRQADPAPHPTKIPSELFYGDPDEEAAVKALKVAGKFHAGKAVDPKVMKGFHQAEAEQKGGLKELQKHVSAKNKAVDPKVVAGFNQAKAEKKTEDKIVKSGAAK